MQDLPRVLLGWAEQTSMHRGRTMAKCKLAFIAFDSAKDKHAVAVAEDGRDGEVRYFGEIENSADAVNKFVTKLNRLMIDCIFATRPARQGMACTDN